MNVLGNNQKYKTYNEIRSDLLVWIPRVKIGENFGYDAWTCWEFSCLDKETGLPYNGILKIVFDASSEKIVESKSLKIYLNSFNNVLMNVGKVEETISQHLFETDYDEKNLVFLYDLWAVDESSPIISYEKKQIVIPLERLKGNVYILSPVILHSTSLQTCCPVTNQPDWADVYIYIEPEENSSIFINDYFLHTIVSLRNKQIFHEKSCEMLYDEFQKNVPCKDLSVACLYTRRGGIDINPVRHRSHFDKVFNLDGGLHQKTARS
jgi:7-cyano-7-deazaguanine reductase